MKSENETELVSVITNFSDIVFYQQKTIWFGDQNGLSKIDSYALTSAVHCCSIIRDLTVGEDDKRFSSINNLNDNEICIDVTISVSYQQYVRLYEWT